MNRISGKPLHFLLLAVYAPALVVCGVSRILLKLNFMDPETGFYLAETGLIHIFNFGLLAATLLLVAAMCFHRPESNRRSVPSSVLCGVFCLLTGLSMIAYVLLEPSLYPVMEQGYAQSMITIRQFIGVILGIASGAVMVWLSIGVFRGKANQYAVYPALIPAIWQAYMLITRFNGFTVVTTITDNMLAILFMGAASLFLIGQARILVNVPRQDGRSFAASTGLCTSLFGLILVLPNVIWMAVNGQTTFPAPMLGVWESVYIVLLSLYGLIFAVNTSRSAK